MTNPDPTYVDPVVETPISATEELAAMLDHKQHIAPELVEEPIELEGESDSATLNWGGYRASGTHHRRSGGVGLVLPRIVFRFRGHRTDQGGG